jgi:hypothetical protein
MTFAGGPGASWTATSSQSNILVSPTSGVGNGLLMLLQHRGAHLAELVDLLVQQLQTFQMQFQKLPMTGLRRAP